MLKLIYSLILGFVCASIYEILSGIIARNVFGKDELVIGDYKLHHSLYGLFFLLLGYLNRRSFFLGFGIGIIIQHTFTDGFKFIELK